MTILMTMRRPLPIPGPGSVQAGLRFAPRRFALARSLGAALLSFAVLPVALLPALLLPAAGALAQSRAPDPINNPTNDVVGPYRARVDAVLPDPMPAIPAASALREFQASAATPNRYGIDPASLLVRERRVIQYTLVVTSPRGVRNIGYEAIDCTRWRVGLLAIGRDGSGWSPVSTINWRPIRADDTVNSHHRELARTWCEGEGTAGDEGELLRRLNAVHPRYIN